MKQNTHLCIQSQIGFYLFAVNFEVDSKILQKNLSKNERQKWFAKLDALEPFVANQFSFVTKEILKQNPNMFFTQTPHSLPFYSEHLIIEVFSDDNDELLCYFLYHKSLKEFLYKYDIYPRYGRGYTLLPMHIQELELQELFLINEGRITLSVCDLREEERLLNVLVNTLCQNEEG